MIIDSFNDNISLSDDTDIRENVRKYAIKQDPAIGDELSSNPQLCIYYDAWANDSDDDPMLSLVYSMIQSVEIGATISSKPDYIQIGASILEMISGTSFSQLASSLKGANYLESINRSRDIKEQITRFLDNLMNERGNRMIIFIDELDRCNPNFAVRLLERIKHYFTNNKITFVFSLNFAELQHIICTQYGSNFDACRYLDRFFDIRMSLPDANLSDFFRYINYADGTTVYETICHSVIDVFHLEMREMCRYLTACNTAINHHNSVPAISNIDYQSSDFCISVFLPIMIGLRLTNVDQYDRFINGKDSSPLIDVANSANLHDRWWNRLLSDNESFNNNSPNNSQKSVVSFNERLSELYTAIFGKITVTSQCTRFGEITINTSIGKMLIKRAMIYPIS